MKSALFEPLGVMIMMQYVCLNKNRCTCCMHAGACITQCNEVSHDRYQKTTAERDLIIASTLDCSVLLKPAQRGYVIFVIFPECTTNWDRKVLLIMLILISNSTQIKSKPQHIVGLEWEVTGQLPFPSF